MTDKIKARLAALLITCLLLLALAVTMAPKGVYAQDPVTGTWGSDGFTNLDLKFDGKRGVSGTTIWREGNTYEHRAAIKTGTFNPETGDLKLEGEGATSDGVVVAYVIQGKIKGDTLTGTYRFGESGGEFTFKKL